MLKNKLWVVALFAALTIAFFGCNTNLGVDPDFEEEEVVRVDLGEFNTIAGQPKQQQGWATNGYVDTDAGKTIEGVDYTIDDFKKAKYVVIETAQNAMGGMQIVWQAKNFPDDGWRTQKFDVLANNSNARPGVTKEANSYGGQTIKINITEVFGASYNNYLSAEDNMRLVLAYYSPNLDDLDVQEAYLLIPTVPVVGNTSLTGLLTEFGFGDTTIRNSASEYGWKFATKDKDGKLPKGIKDVAELRAATHLILVSKGGGIGAGNGVGKFVGFEQLSVILEAGGKSFETKLYKDDIALEHRDNKVYFVIELSTLNGYEDTIDAKVTASEIADIKPPAPVVGDPYGGYTLGSPRWKNVNVILKYASAFENLGLLAGYIFEDNAAGDFDTVVTGLTGAGTKSLEYNNLGVVVGTYGKLTTSGAIAVHLDSEGLVMPAFYPYIEEKKGALGDATIKPESDRIIWGFNGVDGDLDFDLVKDAKYLVLETRGTASQIGGMRIVHQSPNDGWEWNPNSINPWGNNFTFGHVATDTVYIVIDVTTLANWATGIAKPSGDGGEDKGKIIIQYWNIVDLLIRDAYLIPASAATQFAKTNFSDAKDKDTVGGPQAAPLNNGVAYPALEYYITSSSDFTDALSTLYSW